MKIIMRFEMIIKYRENPQFWIHSFFLCLRFSEDISTPIIFAALRPSNAVPEAQLIVNVTDVRIEYSLTHTQTITPYFVFRSSGG